jgi:fused signal recognition particle receptor
MFKFLKKKLKIFEKKLEAELDAELKEEAKEPTPEPSQTKPDITPEPKPPEKPKTVEPPPIPVKEEAKPVKPPEKTAEKKIPKPVTPAEKKPRRLRARLRKKDQQTDKQIEESIEAELQHIVETRRSIEEIVKPEKKPSRGIREEKLDELLWDLEIGLLEADVAYTVIQSIKNDIKNELRNVSFDRSKVSEFVETVLKNAIAHVLKSSAFDFDTLIAKGKKPFVIMFVGVNGSGKTLSIAKVAHYLKQQDKTCVMAAGDTFRAGAIEQLTIHADQLNVKIIKHGPGSDPAAVAYDAIEHAQAKHKDVVLLDTAGRMQTNYNLMDEMAKIKRVAKPDLIIFVGDALAGNDAVEQAKRFNEVVGIDGVILTKVDTDAKGGSSLSIAYTIGKPLLFIGIGQNYEDQIKFDPEWMVNNIFEK